MKDVAGAARELLLGRQSIAALVDDRVYVNQIPHDVIEAEDTFHPQKMLVVRQAGGLAKADLLDIVNITLTVISYGETDYEASRLDRAVYEELLFVDGEVHNGVYLHHFTATGGPIAQTDPELVWPAIAQSYVVTSEAWEVSHV